MRFRLCLALVIGTALALGATQQAQAATYEVTRLNDPVPGACAPNDCSLREAVIAANATGAGDRIVLPRAKTYRLTLATSNEDLAADGDLDITSGKLTILHPGKGRATITAAPGDRHFEVLAGAAAAFDSLVLTEGSAPSLDYPSGGAILVNGSARVTSSVISGNSAHDGGGIAAIGLAADLDVRGSRLIGNRAEDDSGAIHFDARDLSISRTSMIRNVAGTVDNGEGGAMFIWVNGSGHIASSTIARNRALGTPSGGGGIELHEGPLTIVNSTIASNRTTHVGGGVFLSGGALTLNAVTIARNVAGDEGGGLFVDDVAAVKNSLLALNELGNGTASDCDDSGSPLTSGGHNLLSSANTCTGFGAGSDRVRASVGIGALRDNGGPTPTIALKRSSPAIGKAGKDAPARDQRGRKRDRRPDIGAFER